MSRSSVARLRRRLAGTPFDRIWDRAIAEHARRLADPFADVAQAARAGAARRVSDRLRRIGGASAARE